MAVDDLHLAPYRVYQGAVRRTSHPAVSLSRPLSAASAKWRCWSAGWTKRWPRSDSRDATQAYHALVRSHLSGRPSQRAAEGDTLGLKSRESLRRDRLAGGVTPSSATVATDRDSGAVVPTYLCAYEFQTQSRRKRCRFGLARDRLERMQVAALHRRTRADLDHHASHPGVDRRARADR